MFFTDSMSGFSDLHLSFQLQLQHIYFPISTSYQQPSWSLTHMYLSCIYSSCVFARGFSDLHLSFQLQLQHIYSLKSTDHLCKVLVRELICCTWCCKVLMKCVLEFTCVHFSELANCSTLEHLSLARGLSEGFSDLHLSFQHQVQHINSLTSTQEKGLRQGSWLAVLKGQLVEDLYYPCGTVQYTS